MAFEAELSPQHAELLKKLRVYGKFIKNVRAQRGSIYNSYDTDRALWGVLGSAFAWSDTPEGIDFWRNIKEKCKKLEQ